MLGAQKQISLLNISGGRDKVTFQAAIKYKKYLKNRPIELINEWIGFICNDLKLDINILDEKQSLSIPLQIAFNNIDNLAKLIEKLA